MLIALDFDDTYTADPPFWDSFIVLAQRHGHEVICVTCRRDTPENREIVAIPLLRWSSHYFTGLAAKRWFLEQHGIAVDVWLDDDPECVYKGK